ncbi:hypothetical protein BHC44_07500 [Snodgrassella alvi]|nr:hypothetical protein BHC44_07500 [Snodgrassella alvi]
MCCLQVAEKRQRGYGTKYQILNAIGAGLAAPTNSIGGIIAATASPVLSYQIGQYFKGKDAEGSTACCTRRSRGRSRRQ